MRIYVITLNDAAARQQYAESQLQGLGLEFHFFPAMRGEEAMKLPSLRVDEQEFVLATGRHITPGEVGCYVSHRLLWKLCAQLEEPILVMEDDFQLSEDFQAALMLLEAEIAEYGFIRLQSERRAEKTQVKTMGRFALWRYTKAPNSAMCYGISPAAARRLLAHSEMITAPVDVYMKRFWRHGQQMYGITPYSVTESTLSNASQIAGRTKANKNFTTRVRRVFARLNEYLTRTGFNLRLPRRGRTSTANSETTRANAEQTDRKPT
jgi:glycosyl transferase family 25